MPKDAVNYDTEQELELPGNPNFVGENEPNEVNFESGKNIKDIPKSYYNMKWSHLKQLIKDGHSIGAHTKTHAKLSEIKSKNDLRDEIVNSADYMEKMLDISIDYFAFPFGNIDSFSQDALMITKNRFDFIFSGFRGDNNQTSKDFVLFRDSINLNFFDSENFVFKLIPRAFSLIRIMKYISSLFPVIVIG